MSGAVLSDKLISLLNDVADTLVSLPSDVSELIDVNRDVRGHTDEELDTIKYWLEEISVSDDTDLKKAVNLFTKETGLVIW